MAGGLLGCRVFQKHPSIEFTRIPQRDESGHAKHEIIEGRVTGARPGQSIVLYARSGPWWVQPLTSRPFTRIQKDGKWTNATHLGTEYAALVVEPGFEPMATTSTLPSPGGLVAAVAVVPGARTSPSVTLQFSGYEWRVRNAPSNRGGFNNYSPSNAWTDQRGALHLRIAKTSGQWTCAEVSLTRNLGYGTYSFVVDDISRLEPGATFTLFTYDYAGADENFHEMDIEISRWGNPAAKNAQYVVQPYYVAANAERFLAPSGVLTHSFLWEPGRVSFQTFKGSGHPASAQPVAKHAFTTGVPSPGIESVRMNLYVFHAAKVALTNEAEVVVQKFEYLP